MTLRDVNLKLLLLLVLAAACVGSFVAVIFFRHGSLSRHMRIAVIEMSRASELESAGSRLVEVVRVYERRRADENSLFERTRLEVRNLNKTRRAIIAKVELEGPRADAERLESRLGLWLDQVVFYSGGGRRSSKADEMERNIQGFTREYRSEINRELERISKGLDSVNTSVLLLGLLIFFFGCLWFYYMVAGIWQPIRQLQEQIFKNLNSKDEVAAVTVPALQAAVGELLGRYKKTFQAQSIVASMTEGLILVSPNGQIVSANKSILSMLGYKESELIGRNFSDIYVKVKSMHVQGFFKRKETYKEEELFKTAEGKVIPVRFSSSFLFDESMEVQGFVCIAKDITKEKRVEEDLLKQNDWFKITLTSIADAVITADTDGRVNYANKVAIALLGLHDDDDGKLLHQVFRPLDLETQEPVNLLAPGELVASDARPARQHQLERPDGSIISIDLVQAPICNAEGILHGTVLVFHDITDIRRNAEALRIARDRAESALKVKSQFLANMSHEIRTPMNGVVGMTDLLVEMNLSGEQREIVEIIRSSGESLLGLLNDILDLSKVEAGKLTLDSSPFDPRRVVEEVGDLLNKRAHDKGLELVILIHHDLPKWVIGDSGRLRQILLNLVSNSLKFTARGEVVLEVYLADKRGDLCVLHCDVRDTGIGIESGALDQVFHSFTQADASTTRNFGGTGLGLAICKELCEAMGGRIWASSTVGEGSIFSFEINLAEAKRMPREATSISLVGLRILITESNANNRKALSHQLEYLGCKVTHCTLVEIKENLVSAYMRAEPYRALLIDNNQGGMDLPDFLKSIKEDDRFKEMGIILLSSIPTHNLGQGWDQSVDRILTKPIKLHQLQGGVADVLGIAPMSLPVLASGKKSELLHYFRILVADDNIINQKVTVGILENAGYRCEVANNGQEVLEALTETHYSLVLMDCQMPVLDGFEATRKVRALQSPLCDIPIVAMTASAFEGDRERCLDAGMNEYLTKPVRKKALFAVLENLLKDQIGSITGT